MIKTQLTVAAHPDLNLKVKMGPTAVELNSDGTLGIRIGELEAHCDAIPLSMRIPFLRRRRVVAGSVGPFGIHIRPIEAQLRAFDVSLRGLLGKDGMEWDLRGVGACKAEIEGSGRIPAKVAEAALERTLQE